MDVSVVIPTRNRVNSLLRLLESLNTQTCLPQEVIIVDASDEPLVLNNLEACFPRLPIRILHSRPHVCAQRNLGIRTAASEFIFLCDDDIEVPAEYIERVMEVFRTRTDTGAISGLVLEPLPNGSFNNGFYPVSVSTLLFNFIFQLTVWADVGNMKAPLPSSLILLLLRKFYSVRGNRFSLAGWPLLTQVQKPFFETAIYGLGGSIIRREWLLQSPFEELLDPHGIGDNYGVALGFPGLTPIVVLKEASILHHKASDERLPRGEIHMRRIFALDYFMEGSGRFSRLNSFILQWSLVGNCLASLLNHDREMLHASRKALWTLVRNRNPYLEHTGSLAN